MCGSEAVFCSLTAFIVSYMNVMTVTQSDVLQGFFLLPV